MEGGKFPSAIKLLVFEYACAGGPGGEPFLEEGRAMLEALLNDLRGEDFLEVSTLPAIKSGGTENEFITAVEKEIRKADAVWIIAPERGGILHRLVHLSVSLGKKVVGAGLEAIERCSDKLSLASKLNGKILMPKTELFSGRFARFPCVVKPRFGAGCEDVFMIKTPASLKSLKAENDEFIIQDFVDGEHLSAGVLSRGNGSKLLGVCRQKIKTGKKMRFNGLTGPLDYKRTGTLEELIAVIIKNVPGLGGYWGIDFIDRQGELFLIEINPRLTSSYPIYSKSCGFNIARFAVNEGALEPAH